MIEFRRNKEGIIEAWEDGKRKGEVVTMGDLVDGTDEKKPAPKKGKAKKSQSE